MKRILLVEDDLNLGNVLQDFLSMEDFEVILARDGEEGLRFFKKENFDICLLDCMMPKMDGFSLGKEIKKINDHTPLIFLTAKSMKEDKLKGFDLGADDYITKPFDEDELVRRINAVLKRSSKLPETQTIYSVGCVSFDYSNLLLDLDGEKKRITQKEGDLLRYFISNRNKVLRREDILIEVWGVNDYFLGRSLDVFITKLRKHLKVEPSLKISNVHGVGFVMSEE